MGINPNSLEVLQQCMNEKTPVTFASTNVDIVFQTYILEVTNDHVSLQNRVPPEYISKTVESESFSLQANMLRFSSTKIESDGENILFPFGELTEIEETRQTERFPFTMDEQVVCEIKNPYDRETILSKQVLDMSSSGLSIRSPKPSKLFIAGTKFDKIRILIDGEVYTQTPATVVYSRKLFDLSGALRVQVGLKFDSSVHQKDRV